MEPRSLRREFDKIVGQTLGKEVFATVQVCWICASIRSQVLGTP